MASLTRKAKRNEAVLSQDAAKQMLSNVFEACEYEKNRVPMEVLQSYSAYRRERYLLQRGILVVVMILFLLLPVLFITPAVDTAWAPDTPAGRPVLQVKAESPLPIERITASLDGARLEVYHAGEGVYNIRPSQNGELTITVTLNNKQYTIVTVPVEGVDTTPPEMVSSSLEHGELEIILSDDSGEVDFEGIYAMDTKGTRILPQRFDREKMSVTFTQLPPGLNIFVSDICGNTLQLVLDIG